MFDVACQILGLCFENWIPWFVWLKVFYVNTYVSGVLVQFNLWRGETLARLCTGKIGILDWHLAKSESELKISICEKDHWQNHPVF